MSYEQAVLPKDRPYQMYGLVKNNNSCWKCFLLQLVLVLPFWFLFTVLNFQVIKKEEKEAETWQKS